MADKRGYVQIPTQALGGTDGETKAPPSEVVYTLQRIAADVQESTTKPPTVPANQPALFDAEEFATESAEPSAPSDESAHREFIVREIGSTGHGDKDHPESDESLAQKPRALVMAHGKAGHTIARRAVEAGFAVVSPVTKDGKLDALKPEASLSVELGDVYSPALFGNAYAVLQAAKASASSVILLYDEALALASVDSFLFHARKWGISVYFPYEQNGMVLGWLLCEPVGQDRGDPHWRQCHQCKLYFDEASLVKHDYVCPACHTLMRLTPEQRINGLLDIDSFEEWDLNLKEGDPLEFEGYAERLEALRESGKDEAVRTGRARIAGLPVAIGIMDPGFLMGSMGSIVGEKISRLFDRATEQKLVVVMICASGGARMQEGLISLMQMAKVSCAVERHGAAGLGYISVLTDPTTGGVTASFAMQADVIIAEPGALIGFAGKRVIRDTIRQELPEGFQTAEFALEHGLIDGIVERHDLRSTLAQLIALHLPEDSEMQDHVVVTYRSVCDNLEQGTATYNRVSYGAAAQAAADSKEDEEPDGNPFTRFTRRLFNLYSSNKNFEKQIRKAAAKVGIHDWEGDPYTGEVAEHIKASAEEAWENVQLARNVHRPTAQFYLNHMVEGFIELHGDRQLGDDGAIVAGLGWIDGRPVTVVTQEKGKDVKERVRRNFGCPSPQGYRKSLRLMEQAQKFGRPIVCIVDTQGAFCGTDAEEHGQGGAIADNLAAMAGFTVPIVSVLIGEGGSGGALALALANNVAMQEHAVYSVLSPEGFASILWKDRSRAPEAASVMRMSASDALALGVVDAVLSEGEGAAHENPDQAAQQVTDYVKASLRDLGGMDPEDVWMQRQFRFAAF